VKSEPKILEEITNKRKGDILDIHDVKQGIKIKKIAADHEYFTLNTGDKMPKVQFGTYKMKGEDCYEGVFSAIKMGYKGLDTASVYDNEEEVGKALKDVGISRNEVFVQTKLWRSFVGRNPKNGKPKCDAELRKSLRKLGLEYVDMWLMHWPGPGRHLNYPPVKQGMARPKVVMDKNKDKMVPLDWSPSMRVSTWSDMVANVGPKGSGKPVRAAGVCNFSERQLQDLLTFCEDNKLQKPSVVQNECHPFLQAKGVRSLCEKEGIIFQAYASLGAGSLGLCQDPVVKEVSSNADMSPGQVLLRWAVQNGCAVLPKSSQEKRRKENMDVLDWKLEKEDMEKLNSMEKAVAGQNTMAGWLRRHGKT